MDRNRICTDYWESRPFHAQSHNNGDNSLKIQEPNTPNATQNNNLTPVTDNIISGLFKKANLEELNAFLSVLSNDNSTRDQQVVTKLLNDEILKRPR